jgi:hypothetical protein
MKKRKLTLALTQLKGLAALLGSLLLAGCGAPERTANPGTREKQELFGPKLTPSQVAGYLRRAGFPERIVGTMVCVAKYESSYDPSAYNSNTNGTSDYGLFQINTYWWGEACNVTGQQLYDPAVNSRCALQVYREQGLEAWYGYRYNRAECNNTPAPR